MFMALCLALLFCYFSVSFISLLAMSRLRLGSGLALGWVSDSHVDFNNIFISKFLGGGILHRHMQAFALLEFIFIPIARNICRV